jgi:hypothetical protein
MTKTVQLQFPKDGCRPLSKKAQALPGSSPVLNGTVKKISRPYMGFLWLGMSGVTESTSLVDILVRLFFSLARWLLAAAKHSPQTEKLPTRTSLAETEPLEGDHVKSERRATAEIPSGTRLFRRAWTHPNPGAAFHDKSLMRMTHPPLL